MTEEEIQELERVGNMARGMTMDQRIPSEVRDLLHGMADRIDAVLDPHLEAYR